MNKIKKILLICLSLAMTLGPWPGISAQAEGMGTSTSQGKALKIERIEGRDRYETALAINEKYYPKSDEAIVARGDGYVDALISSSLSAQEGIPIYLVDNKRQEKVIEDLKKSGVKQVYLVGGTRALSADFQAKLEENGLVVMRFSGNDRHQTADQLNRERFRLKYPKENKYSAKKAVFSNSSYVDALAGGPFVGLMARENMGFYSFSPADQEEYIKGVDMVFGGDRAGEKSPYQLSSLKGKDKLGFVRFAGENRFETSVKVAQAYKDILDIKVDTIILANGMNYPDALAASSISFKEKAPILLTDGRDLDESVEKYISQNPSIKNVLILGGDKAIGKNVESDLREVKR